LINENPFIDRTEKETGKKKEKRKKKDRTKQERFHFAVPSIFFSNREITS